MRPQHNDPRCACTRSSGQCVSDSKTTIDLDSGFIISTVDLLYRQSIYYIDSGFIISTVDLLYQESIYFTDSRFIISTVDLLYRQ